MTLTARARRAAELARRADPGGFERRFTDPVGWKVRARHAATLACMLGIDPADVTVRADPARTYGGSYPVPLLHVPDAAAPAVAVPRDPGDDEHGAAHAARGFWFIPETADPAVFLTLGGCPQCGGLVPVARIAHLADLGAALSGGQGDPAEVLPGRLPDEFNGDAGHSPACPHRRS
jgi:hypothetical protein